MTSTERTAGTVTTVAGQKRQAWRSDLVGVMYLASTGKPGGSTWRKANAKLASTFKADVPTVRTVAEDVDHYDGLRDSVDPSLYPEDRP